MSDAKRFDNGMAKDAETFAGMVNNPDIGGSSYHVLSRQFLNVGVDNGHMVGGHPFAGTTTRIPESFHDSPLSAHEAHAHFVRTAVHTGGDSKAYAGGWAENGKGVLDASTRIDSKKDAIPVAQFRGEREIFDSQKIESYKTPGVPEGNTNAAPPAAANAPKPTVTKTKRGSTLVQSNLRTVRA
jgi:hypothetical protein